MLFLTSAVIIVQLLFFIAFVDTSLCSPTFPEKLTFDLNQLCEEATAVNEWEISHQAPPSSSHGFEENVDGSGTHAHIHASQTRPTAPGGRFWHAAGQLSSQFNPTGAIDRLHYAHVPALVHQPVLVQRPGQHLAHATEYSWPYHQLHTDNGQDAPGSSSISNLAGPSFMASSTSKGTNVALPQRDQSVLFQSDIGSHREGDVNLYGAQQATLRRTMSNPEAGSSSDIAEREPQGSETNLPGSESDRLKSDLAPLPLDATTIRNLAVQDPKIFSKAHFRFSLGTDPDIGRLVNSLTSPDSTVRLSAGRMHDQDQVQEQFPNDLFRLFSSYFWTRKKAKQILLKTESGTRSLFFIFLTDTRLMPGRSFSSHTSVWEIASSKERGVLSMLCYAFYPFSETDFLNLERHRQSTGRNYWFKFNQKTVAPDRPMPLLILPANADVADEGVLAELARQHPEMRSLIWTGKLQRALSTSSYVLGKHYYVAAEFSPDVSVAIQRWKSDANLSQDMFLPLRLDAKQIEELPYVTVAHYRSSKDVTAITEPNGDVYMMEFAQNLHWFHQYRGPLVSVWKVGPLVEGRELLIFKGLFQLSAEEFEELRPERVPGLRFASFQNNIMWSS
ncbi:uncharacterized protein SRS1_10311 [Sporisorium reilianum f. sp. reilianum]|uniref:Uncharacterized protein n=1 Tax=Sporisorium reilianum f. sp. reilianum TaxID=72559 RepID=A0A2N8U9F1_9BASI|nr:uncharacterized protein SRS1_10311 [Sporisorium reilianum f. sp. reilianum]